MTEQAVKDAKAKFDGAKSELDKAVKDTQDEIAKAKDAISAAVAPKIEKPVEAAKPESVKAPEALRPVAVPKVTVVPAAKSNFIRNVIVGIALGTVAYFVAKYFHAL